jgi:hypothetical protein
MSPELSLQVSWFRSSHAFASVDCGLTQMVKREPSPWISVTLSSDGHHFSQKKSMDETLHIFRVAEFRLDHVVPIVVIYTSHCELIVNTALTTSLKDVRNLFWFLSNLPKIFLLACLPPRKSSYAFKIGRRMVFTETASSNHFLNNLRPDLESSHVR